MSDEILFHSAKKVEQFIAHREYLKYYVPPDEPSTTISDINKNIFYYKSYQKLTANLVDINSPLVRALLEFETGVGKTITALKPAISYVMTLRSLGIQEAKVIVVGFSKSVFVNELLSRPELGFVTEEDIKESQSKLDLVNINALPREEYKKYRGALKRRLTNQRQGGYFMFMGYKELNNDLFRLKGIDKLPNTVSGIKEAIKQNQISINTELLSRFEHSFVIADEFHKMYSSTEINTYGLSFKFIMDYYQNWETYKHLDLPVPRSNIKLVLLSATPLTHKPHEVIDMLNLLVPGLELNESDIFTGKHLTSGSLDKIKKLFRGRVSYVRNVDAKLFPQRVFEGKKLPGIKYLSFIKCDPSPQQQKLLSQHPKLTLEEYPLMDYILPIPGSKGKIQYTYSWNQAYQAYQDDPGFLTKNGWALVNDSTLSGLDLSVYSVKYKRMREYVLQAEGKILIYHNNIQGSGVLFIAQVLADAGYIPYDSDITASTICLVCKIPFQDHNPSQIRAKGFEEHIFIASRYIVLHGEMRKEVINDHITAFNSSNNTDGYQCQVCIGSRMIREALSFLDTRHLYVMVFPDSIGNLIQVIGRAWRMFAHQRLPQHKRKLYILIFVASQQEINKYKDAMSSYLEIQKIDKVRHEVAIDAVLNRQLIIKDLHQHSLFAEYFQPDTKLPTKPDDTLFYKYYISEEVEELMNIIKLIFSHYSKIWRLQDLWEFIHHMDLNLELDPDYILYESFIIAINILTSGFYMPYITGINPNFNIGDISYHIVNIQKGQDNYLISIPAKYDQTELGISSDITISEIYYDAWYRPPPTITNKNINISSYLDTKRLDLDTMRYIYLKIHAESNLETMTTSMNEYSMEFHIYMIKYCVRYVFSTYTNLSVNLIEYHYVLLKLYYIYSSLGYIIFLSDLEGKPEYDLFLEYVTDDPSVLTSDQKDIAEVQNSYDRLLRTYSRNLLEKTNISFSGIDNLISSSGRIPQTSVHDIILKDKWKIQKVPAFILPVGYTICTRVSYEYSIYDINLEKESKDPWVVKYEPLFNISGKENPIIIGYDIDSNRVIDRQFKLRQPISDTYSDKRLINKGMSCSSYKKHELLDICKQLGITPSSSKNLDVCHQIKINLLNREIEERYKGSGIKWFYMSFEYNPLRH